MIDAVGRIVEARQYVRETIESLGPEDDIILVTLTGVASGLTLALDLILET
jgi:hypothetical protein